MRGRRGAAAAQYRAQGVAQPSQRARRRPGRRSERAALGDRRGGGRPATPRARCAPRPRPRPHQSRVPPSAPPLPLIRPPPPPASARHAAPAARACTAAQPQQRRHRQAAGLPLHAQARGARGRRGRRRSNAARPPQGRVPAALAVRDLHVRRPRWRRLGGGGAAPAAARRVRRHARMRGAAHPPRCARPASPDAPRPPWPRLVRTLAVGLAGGRAAGGGAPIPAPRPRATQAPPSRCATQPTRTSASCGRRTRTLSSGSSGCGWWRRRGTARTIGSRAGGGPRSRRSTRSRPRSPRC